MRGDELHTVKAQFDSNQAKKRTMAMATPTVPQVDVERARAAWSDYCRQHDITKLKGKTAGIEPVSGRIWFGDSAVDVHDKMLADGVNALAYFIRVGYDHYVRKGGHR
jgi:hypothetical protein